MRWQWYYLVPIALCTTTLILVCRKKTKKAFDILMINLLAQNIMFLVTFTYSYVEEGKVLYVVMEIVNKCCYHLQLLTFLSLTLQRAAMVYSPIRANVWITRQTTIKAVAIEYTVVCIFRGIAFPVLQRKKKSIMLLVLKWTLSVFYLSGIFIVTISLIAIVYKVRQRHKFDLGRQSTSRNKERTTKVLICNHVRCACFCWLYERCK